MQPRATRRGILICLVVSLGLNLLLGGHALESWIMPRLSGANAPGADAAVERMASRLPEPDARILRDTFAQVRVRLHDLIDRQRATHEQIKAALTAVPFDPAAFERQMAISREQHQAITALMADTFRRALEAMSNDGRTAFARNDKGGRSG
jgi:uncharacterized membrane protein